MASSRIDPSEPPSSQRIVLAAWPAVIPNHLFQAKWNHTKRAWYRFNELFGGFDPVKDPPSFWCEKPEGVIPSSY